MRLWRTHRKILEEIERAGYPVRVLEKEIIIGPFRIVRELFFWRASSGVLYRDHRYHVFRDGERVKTFILLSEALKFVRDELLRR